MMRPHYPSTIPRRFLLRPHPNSTLVDQTSCETVSLFREKDPILFDASSEDTCTWRTNEVARRSHLHACSRYVLGDRLKIKCAIFICGDLLTFDDPPPTPSSGLPLFQQVGYGKGEPDVVIQVEGGTIGAHYCILDAHCT
ncbi:Speckle-type POZ protein-like protein [Hordeum vulgare]|nr:Speckle-type POZ protein-like protein [Hordeum vulgare]